jgi:hypothetical protein
MTEGKTNTTRTGRVLSDADIQAIADEAERGYDVDALLAKRRGGVVLPSGKPLQKVVPVRIDPALRRALEAQREG